MDYKYQLIIIDDETDEIVYTVLTFSQESLEEELGKSKIQKAIAEYEAKMSGVLEYK